MNIDLTQTFAGYERGKKIISLIINVFVLVGFVMEILIFYRKYIPLQLFLQIVSTCIFFFTLALQVYHQGKFYKLAFLIMNYYLLTNIIVYDFFFPNLWRNCSLPEVILLKKSARYSSINWCYRIYKWQKTYHNSGDHSSFIRSISVYSE